MAYNTRNKVKQDPRGAGAIPKSSEGIGYGQGPDDSLDTAHDVASAWENIAGIDYGHMSKGSNRAEGNPEPDAPGSRRLGGFSQNDGNIKNNNVLIGFDGSVDRDNG